MIKHISIIIAVALVTAVAVCGDVHIVQRNMTKAADNFEISRRIVLWNTITNSPIMVTEGICSVEPGERQTSVLCKVGHEKYVRHFYGRSDNTLYFVEQIGEVSTNAYHYRRTFKPQTLIPDINLLMSGEAFGKALTEKHEVSHNDD